MYIHISFSTMRKVPFVCICISVYITGWVFVGILRIGGLGGKLYGFP